MIHFNIRFLSKVLFFGILMLISLVSFTNSGGPGGGNTPAPGETPCGGCHGGATTSGTAWDAITLTGITGNNYAPGQTYSVTVNGGSAATAKNGFQITALSPTNAMAGSFTAGTGNAVSSSGGKSYVTHTSAGNASSSWTFTWIAPATNVGTVTFYLSYNATNNNSQSTGDVVYAKSFAISGGNPPVATITGPPNNITFCLGDSVQFTGIATNNPTSYQWDFLGVVPSSSSLQNPKIKLGGTAGTKTIRFRATNASGTSTNAQITINVIAKPSATITAPTTVVCGNDSVTLTANSGAGLTYVWSPGGATSQSIKTVTAGSYSVTVTAGGACSTTSTPVTITTSPKPTVVLTLSKDSICSGDSIQLSASSGMQVYEYFANGSRIDSTTSNSIWFKPNGTAQLSVKATVGPCSATSATKVIHVFSKASAPVIACGPSTTSSITYTISGANPQISLDSGKTWASPNQGSNHIISGLSPNQQVTIWGRNQTGGPCQLSLVSNKTCVASNCTPISYSVTGINRYYCLGTQGVMVRGKVTNATGTDPYYRFYLPGGNLNPPFTKVDSFSFLLNSVGNKNIYISVKDSANPTCPSKDTVYIITGVAPASPAPILSLGKQLFCQTDSITLRPLLLQNQVNKVEYYKGTQLISSRMKNQGFAYGPVAVTPQFPNGTSLSLIAIDSISGCGTASTPVVMTVKENPKVDFTISKTNLDVILNDTSSETARRVWLLEGDSFPTTNRIYNYTFKNAGATQIIMKGYSSFECMSTASKAVTINATGMFELPNALGLRAYPNPAKDKLFVEWQANENELELSIMDQLGKVVLSQKVRKGEQVNTFQLAPGIYLLQLSSEKESSQMKLLIE